MFWFRKQKIRIVTPVYNGPGGCACGALPVIRKKRG